ncbi:uncharacterized protein Tco_1226502 [Tanacetum coccineum]
MNISMRDFNECVGNVEIADVNSTGLHYTWNQKPKGDYGILKKIDRVMANLGFASEFPGSYAVFQPYRISDHAPAVLRIRKISSDKPKPFKFFYFLSYKPEFLQVVTNQWGINVNGHNMFRLVKRLRGMKKPLRKLLHAQSNIHERVKRLRYELDEVQKVLDKNPASSSLRDEEAVYLDAFNQATLDEERYLKQKAKIEWLRVGDTNSGYFHRSVKANVSRSRSEDTVAPLDEDGLFTHKLNSDKALFMVRQVTNEEIKDVIFNIGNDKAPGPDGFTSVFFKKAWDIVGNDVCNAVKDFFSNGHILREINHTIIALLSKVTTPSKINDYRPISCCNVIYKCVSKIITNRIKNGLDDVVSVNQSAFIPGRSISDNILLTQELMHNYHLNRGPPRCAFKIDIQKAYDTVSWKFLNNILMGFGFHKTMIKWIMACVSSTSYSINVNGELHGYFQGNIGLRQGDPMSPYLFTLVMEILTLMLKRRVREDCAFSYHNRCSKQTIINICFADDLIMFSRGDIQSAKILMEALKEFKYASGLVSSIPKGTVFFFNVVTHVKTAILQLMPFEEGSLPIKYLGVPLISSRLLHKDCKILVERVQKRIRDWKNKWLSFAGRLQLCLSVISFMHVYWASVFILPIGIINDIEQLCVGFYGAKVRWIHSYKLRRRSFWDVPLGSNVSWGWRKLLQIRNIIRPHVWHSIGDGKEASMWFDTWDSKCPLMNILSYRAIHNAGLSIEAKVADLILDNGWSWPDQWSTRYYSTLATINVPILHDHADMLRWKDVDGNLRPFSVTLAWNTIRERRDIVQWSYIVWSKYCIPRHVAHLWLVMRRTLKTQDRLRPWDVGGDVDLSSLRCPLCKSDIMRWILPIARKNNVICIVGRLIIAASSYYIWQERNNMLHMNCSRSVEQLASAILDMVRLKLGTIKFKRNARVAKLKTTWN